MIRSAIARPSRRPFKLSDGGGPRLALLMPIVLSIDAVQFKTHPRVYDYGLQQLGVRAEQVSSQSSNAWDAFAAASAHGMRVVWCNRYGQRRERLPCAPDHEVRSLAELPALLAPPGSRYRMGETTR